jgi:integrase
LNRAQAKGQAETARRLKSALSAVFRLAISTTRAESDPTQVLKGATSAPVVQSYAAITDEVDFGNLMASLYDYAGWPTVRLGMIYTSLTASRPGMVRLAEWPEFDMAAKVWTVPAERMKMRREHRVPLSRQAIAVIEEIRPITGRDRFVFASMHDGDKAISENAMNSALRRMGYTQEEHVSHGFRSSFSTIMNKRRYDPELIEVSLAHKDTSVRGIYNRGDYLEERAVLMQAWADLIDELRGLKAGKFDHLI